MDTTCPLPFLPSVDITDDTLDSEESLTRTQLAYLGCVHITATPDSMGALLHFLSKHISSIEAYVDVSQIDSVDDVIAILNAGAKKIFCLSTIFKNSESFGNRVVPILHKGDSSQAYPYGVLLEAPTLEETEAGLKKLSTWNTTPIYITTTSTDEDAIIALAKDFSAVPVIPAKNLTINRASQTKISIPALIAGTWRSDREDKLVPTMVVTETGVALGLVYSDHESVGESLRIGQGVYKSRKRGLWHKGAISGFTQDLVRISLDCDQDCLKFMVRQQGPGKAGSSLRCVLFY